MVYTCRYAITSNMTILEKANHEVYKKSYAFAREVYAVLGVSETGEGSTPAVNSKVCHGVKFPVSRLIDSTISNIHDNSKRRVTREF